MENIIYTPTRRRDIDNAIQQYCENKDYPRFYRTVKAGLRNCAHRVRGVWAFAFACDA